MLFVEVGGRNRKVAEAYAKNGGKRFVFLSFVQTTFGWIKGNVVDVILFKFCVSFLYRSFEELEAEILRGQKLQVHTLNLLWETLRAFIFLLPITVSPGVDPLILFRGLKNLHSSDVGNWDTINTITLRN